MEKLDSFDFDARPSRSRYAPVVAALVDEGTFAVKIKRGEDEMFPPGVKIDTIQAGVRTALRKAGKRARVRTPSDDVVVVGLKDDSAPRRRPKRPLAVAA